jgi:pimeloyl-ACP methyl ester carboxylesterase
VKKRIPLIALVVSLLINVIGAVLFVAYLKTLGELKHMTQERSILSTMLSYAQTSNVVGQLDPDRIDKVAFISQFDNNEDIYAIEPIALPIHTKEVTLFVFLHGLGQTCMEPFEKPDGAPFSESIIKRDHSYVMMAPNYRSPAGWVTDATLSDITQSIRMVLAQYPVKQIYIVGSSMGGCTSLSYCALAPNDIKKKLAGLVCVEGSGDLAALYKKTNIDSVRTTMQQQYGGSPDTVSVAYASKSMLPNISAVPGQMRFAIISARQDTTVPPEFQDAVYNALKSQGRPVLMIPIQQGHGWPPLSILNQAVDFVLQQPKTDKGH